MKSTAIVAILEPLSFSMERSLAWSLGSTLRKKGTYSLLGSAPAGAAELIGLVPILQPIRASLNKATAFIVFTRVLFDAPDGLNVGLNDTYTLVDSEKHSVGTLQVNSIRNNLPPSLLLASPEFARSGALEVKSLRSFLADVTENLWPSEPINWTTHSLHLASSGQFLAAHEINESGLATGILVADDTGVNVAVGTKPLIRLYRAFRKAGALTTAVRGGGSDSYCTDGGGSSSGGDVGSGAASLGGGGHTDGNTYAAIGGTAGGTGGSYGGSSGGTGG